MDKIKRCASDQCVEIEPHGFEFRFTSSIEGNDGSVAYTAAETAKFFDDVKAGKFDNVHAAAVEMAAVDA